MTKNNFSTSSSSLTELPSSSTTPSEDPLANLLNISSSSISTTNNKEITISNGLKNLSNCVIIYINTIKQLPYIQYSTAIQECIANLETMNTTIIQYYTTLLSTSSTTTTLISSKNIDPDSITIVNTSINPSTIMNIHDIDPDQLYRKYIKYIADLIITKLIYMNHTIYFYPILTSISIPNSTTKNHDSNWIDKLNQEEEIQFYQSMREQCDPLLVTIIQDLVKVSIVRKQGIILMMRSLF